MSIIGELLSGEGLERAELHFGEITPFRGLWTNHNHGTNIVTEGIMPVSIYDKKTGEEVSWRNFLVLISTYSDGDRPGEYVGFEAYEYLEDEDGFGFREIDLPDKFRKEIGAHVKSAFPSYG